jgi:hypothetical protein
MVCPSLIASDDAIEKFLAFVAVLLQKMRADAHMIARVLFSQFPRNPPFTNFVEFKNVMHY